MAVYPFAGRGSEGVTDDEWMEQKHLNSLTDGTQACVM